MKQFKVEHELAKPEEYQARAFHVGTDPALEVDGRLFVDPNVDALKKIFRIK